jgi:predicted cobalt transporter CbtA
VRRPPGRTAPDTEPARHLTKPVPEASMGDRPRAAVIGAAAIGVVAGLVAALFMTVAAAPSVEEAIRLEQAAHAHSAGHAHPEGQEEGDELVSRGVQRGVGLFGAYALSGAAFGVLLGSAFLLAARHRPDPFRRALLCGAVLAGAVTVSPWLKYPPNPPAVGDPDTLASRQGLYLAVIVLTAAVGVAAARLARRLVARGWPEPWRVAAVTAAVTLPLLAAYALLPGAPGPIDVPAGLLWRFRLASLGGNLVLWAVLVLGFAAAVAGRRARPARPPGARTGASVA